MARTMPPELKDAFVEDNVVYGVDWNLRRGARRPAPPANDPTRWDPMRPSPLMTFDSPPAYVGVDLSRSADLGAEVVVVVGPDGDLHFLETDR